MTRHIDDARQVLRELLDGPLRLTPIDEPTRRGYRFEGAVTFGDPLTGTVECPCDGVPGQN
jgi:hypothetical protein